MRRLCSVLVLASLIGGACGGGGTARNDADGGGEKRTVLVDYRHDEFTSAFLSYYPKHLTIRPGDTVDFRQEWTGEPHSVTFGKVVDDFIEVFPKVAKYDSPETALAAGESKDLVDRAVNAFGKLPGMVEGFEVAQAGAEPCFVENDADVPLVRDLENDALILDAKCPTKGRRQPAFTGRQALYNSGFIPYVGRGANSFSMKVADDATPGTYQYFCNYHFIGMSGTIEIAEPNARVLSQTAISKEARKEIEVDAKQAVRKVKAAQAVKAGGTIDKVELPLAGLALGRESRVIASEFLPGRINAKVGEKVTWTFDGSVHTVSFNVPKYFPIFTVDADDGTVVWSPNSHRPVGFDIPEQDTSHQEESPPPVNVDAGTWDGKGGFHSSGALNPGDTFSVAFSKSGTYAYACVLHPQMVGTLVVK